MKSALLGYLGGEARRFGTDGGYRDQDLRPDFFDAATGPRQTDELTHPTGRTNTG